LATSSSANIIMITDFDVSGMIMSRDYSHFHRLGIDFETLDYFGLSREEVQETYNTSKPTMDNDKTAYNHYEGLKRKGTGLIIDFETWKSNMEYLRKYRIEIDSVIRNPKVRNARFWQWIVDKLIEKFPTRNYNRAIEVKEVEYPTLFFEFRRLLKERSQRILKDDVEETKKDLETYDGIIDDVNNKENEIRQNFAEIVDNDKSLTSINEKLQEMIDELKESD